MNEESLKERILALAVQEEGKIDVEAIIREVGNDLLEFVAEMPLADFQEFSNLQIPDVRRKVLQHFLDVVE